MFNPRVSPEERITTPKSIAELTPGRYFVIFIDDTRYEYDSYNPEKSLQRPAIRMDVYPNEATWRKAVETSVTLGHPPQKLRPAILDVPEVKVDIKIKVDIDPPKGPVYRGPLSERDDYDSTIKRDGDGRVVSPEERR